MATVTFIRADMSQPITVRVRSFEQRTLLSLLMQLELVDENMCGLAHCGSCAVKVAVKSCGNEPRPVRLDDNEKTILFESGRLSREQYEAPVVPARPALWRLACRYVVKYEEIVVAM